MVDLKIIFIISLILIKFAPTNIEREVAINL